MLPYLSRLPSVSWFAVILYSLTLLAYLALFISPEWGALWAFWAWTAPLWWALHLALAVLLAWAKAPQYRYSLAWVIVGLPLAWRSFALGWSVESVDFGSGDAVSLQVLSYNVRVFNAYAHLEAASNHSPEALLDWVAQHPADIKCLQEYYNASTSRRFRTWAALRQKTPYYYHSPQVNLHADKGAFGTIIFSRYPIIAGGNISLGTRPHEQGVWADIRVGKRTLRVMNVHLQSMYLDVDSLKSGLLEDVLPQTYRRLAAGFVARATQVHTLTRLIRASPHPVLLVGDFNELPYSYVYQSLRNMLGNAHETRGWAWGFSYRGGIPLLRIDHQFYDKGLRCDDFDTLGDIDFTDHYPLLGAYSLPQ